MNTIAEIYEQYQIMPNLQLHQLRVAAAAKQICEAQKMEVDTQSVISACLLHDMGNILKFDLLYFPQFLEPQGLAYWESAKQSFKDKYGPDEHAATVAIAKELGVSDAVFSYVSSIGFSNITKNVADPSLEKKICGYADLRVGPFGVLTIDERLSDGRQRYAGKKHSISSEKYATLADGLKPLEQQVFEQATIQPADITDESIAPNIELLRSFKPLLAGRQA
ncbi:MAG: HD domain-containing protein [Parcubacteria group bacterium]|nr:HD domain-containing protein [Parcubacteria group bacterium]